MNCRAIESLVSAERDGVLTAAQHAALAEHLTACPACRQYRVGLNAMMDEVRADAAKVKTPDIDEEWREIRARIRDDTAGARKKKTLTPVLWLSVPLAAAAAVAFSFFVHQPPASAPTNEGAPAPSAAVASAEFVETGDAKASTVVYVDKESGWLVVWAADADKAASG